MMSPTPRGETIKYVPANIIQRLFNNSKYPGMIARGQLIPRYLHDGQLKEPEKRKYPEPYGTRSQTIRYYDSNRQWVVVVHQYLRPDGTLGASGKQDPKRLRIGNTIFIFERQSHT
jgi:hypothetical protein